MSTHIFPAFTLCALLALAGCNDKQTAMQEPAAPGANPVAPKAAEPPLKVEGLQDDMPGASEMVIKDPTAAQRRIQSGYVHDEQIPSGGIRVICIMPSKGLPPPLEEKPVEFSGDNAIQNPKEGEADFYRKLKLKQRQWVRKGEAKDHFEVSGAILILKDVKAGRRPPLNRTGFNVLDGNLDEVGARGARHGLSAGPLNDRVQFGTWDKFPCAIALRGPGGAVVYEGETIPYDDTALKAGSWGVPAAKMIVSETLRECGVYTAACKRHPFQTAFLYVSDNPYVFIVTNAYKTHKFAADDLPVGTHTMEVWHPELEPAQKTMQIEIKKDKVLELALEFKPRS